MKNTIINNSLFFNFILKIYNLISVYIKHSLIYRFFCSFTNLLQIYSRNSKILNYLTKKPEYQSMSLYKICISKLEKFIIELIEIINNMYTKIFLNSFFFNFFYRIIKNTKENNEIYISLTLLTSIVSFNILSLYFYKINTNQLIISILSITTIIIFNINSNNIIENSSFINLLYKLSNSNIEE